MQIFNPFDHQYWVQIGVAVLCGGMIGIERELRGKPTGMRTCILIVMGTAIFVKLGAVMGNERGDATRVLGQVVTGIGFLGAGVIMARGDVIIGVTTAAVVWVLAAIGALIGAGEFACAISTAIVTVVCLTVFDYIERWIQKHR
ncbi:MAG TPA: MgtC/SapB family protein [Planctomycetaceae bacterium]|jgi:putative Mg2+ transporter-C (MgtC) family protein|nr:MgtC/SapB family protein [Planctomycetaceae bacterium]